MSGSDQHHRVRWLRFRYSLRWLFVVTAIVAVVAAYYGTKHRNRLARERAVEFLAAVERGDLETTDRLLKLDPGLAHGQEHHGIIFPRTALQTALVANVNPEVVERILQEGLDLEATAEGGKTALHMRVEANDPPTVELLLSAGAKVDARDATGQTALHYAMNGSDGAVQLLLRHGADLTARDNAGLIPGERSDGTNADMAASAWWNEIVQAHDQGTVGELDATLDSLPQVLSFRFGYAPSTMLHRAVTARRLDVLNYLLRRKVDVNVRDSDGATPLHYLSWIRRSSRLPQRLLDAGADVEAKDKQGRTALHWAALVHNLEMVRLLIAAGADVRALDNDGTSVMDAAFERAFYSVQGEEVLEALRAAGHPPTVLYAAATGDLDLLREQAREDAGALDRRYTRSGVRPLHAAVLGDQPAVAEWLVEQGADRNASGRGDSGEPPVDTPLMLALSRNKADVAIRLIELGADVDGEGRSGQRPVHAVIASGRDPRILEALLARGADISVNYGNQTIKELAAASRSEHRARYVELLGAGGDE